MNPKNPTSIRLSDEAKRLLVAMADKLAISQSAALEMAIRELARKWGILKRIKL